MTTRIGLIGTGNIAKNHLKNLLDMKELQVSAICDIQPGRAEQLAQECPGAQAYTNVMSMLDDLRLDGVYVCVPPMAHGEIELELVERGIPFLVEKPIGIDLDIPRKIRDSVNKKNLITSTGYHMRYHDSTKRAKEWIRDSQVGMAIGYWLGGMPRVPWWRRMEGSGGQFNEQTTHIVDLLRYLCGEVQEVYATFALRAMHEQLEGTNIPDVGTVTLKMKNGMVASISNSCMLPCSHRSGLDLYTVSGVLELRNTGLTKISEAGNEYYENQTNPYLMEDEAFIHAIRTGDTSRILSTYADALQTHEVTMAVNESAKGGIPVTV